MHVSSLSHTQAHSHTHTHTMGSSNVTEEEGWLKVMEVVTLTCLPLAARAAVQLNVPHILAEHAGPEQYLSPSQIASHFEPPLASTTTLEQAAASLDRILRVLACHGLLSSSLLTSPHEGGLAIRTYGLNSYSHYLLQTAAQTSLAPFLLFQQDPLILQPFFHMHEAVLDGASPFEKAHGMPGWPFLETQPRLNDLFNQSMINYSNPLTHAFLDTYHGFDNVTSLIDVGGGHGACLHMITSKHPHIQGINFDQPHVVADAPSYPGIKHVGGDMFREIPQASAIFMKGILHDWSDAHCSKLLKNCYRALPEKGKVITVGAILPAQVDCKPSSRVTYHMDLLMFAFMQGGRERTYHELENLCKASGFSRLKVICNTHANSVLEIYKEPLGAV